ncbi:MAG: permease-like cell division protein FtsX, partial [Saprospiraceae bacterium]|nr:permease-like cell division protein FtsX [Saprospiraceae bacterium]
MRRKDRGNKQFAGQTVGLNAIWREGQTLVPQNRKQLFLQHLRSALISMWRSSLTTTLTMLTIAIVFFFIGTLLVVARNVNSTVERGSRNVAASVYLKEDASPEEVKALEQKLKDSPQVAEVHYLAKDAALREFRRALGEDSHILDGLEAQNPLPASFEIRFSIESQEGYDFLRHSLKDSGAVVEVQFNESLARQFSGLDEILRVQGTCAVGIILVLAAFVIANTLTLSLYAHRDELEIMSLMGAHRMFVRAPYLIEGMFQGVIGSAFGLSAVYAVFRIASHVELNNALVAMIVRKMEFIS